MLEFESRKEPFGKPEGRTHISRLPVNRVNFQTGLVAGGTG